jgi:hypothetical protein
MPTRNLFYRTSVEFSLVRNSHRILILIQIRTAALLAMAGIERDRPPL